MSEAKLSKQCDAWNAKHPVGTKVKVRLDSGEIRETVTTSPAGVLSGHSAVIWLEGIRGCYRLDRVTPLANVDPVRVAIDALRSLSDEQRAEAIHHFCTHCGSENPRCQCWNDE